MEKKTKLFKGTVKTFDEKTHRATIMISTREIDRDQEVIEPGAFKAKLAAYTAHPILLSSHRTETLLRQIGKAHEIRLTQEGVEGDYEWFVGKNNPEADWGWFLVTKGIAAFSIGFMPYKWLDNCSTPKISAEDSAAGILRRYTEIELLENSQVLVPSNRGALQLRIAEAKGEEKELYELAIKSIKDEEWKEEESVTMSKGDIEALVKSEVDKATKKIIDDTLKQLKEQSPLGKGPKALPIPTEAEVRGWIKEAVGSI